MRGILLICLRRLGRDLKLADGSNEDKVATGMPRSVMTIRSLPAARLTQRPVSRWSSRMLIFFMCTLCHKAVCSFKLAARVRSYESLCALRARQEIRCAFCCWPPGPLARRERRAYPLRYVRSEQHSQRACGPQARRGAAAGGHLRRCRSSTMPPHRLRRGALHLPARRSRQNAHLIFWRALSVLAVNSGSLWTRRQDFLCVSVALWPSSRCSGLHPAMKNGKALK